jgi:hypothetical protein
MFRFSMLWIPWVVVLGIWSSIGLSVESVSPELIEKVRRLREEFSRLAKGTECSVEGVDSSSIRFRGNFSILNGVTLPQPFPTDGGLLFYRTPGFQPREDKQDQAVRVVNSQYSFALIRKNAESRWWVDDLKVQLTNQNRTDLAKDGNYLRFITDFMQGFWAPVQVYDVDAIDLLDGKDGVSAIPIDSSNQSTGKRYEIEFVFPPSHPYKHDRVRVSFGNSGEVLGYELKEVPNQGYISIYSVEVRYSPECVLDAVPMTNEYHAVSKLIGPDGKSPAPAKIFSKWSDYRRVDKKLNEFTISHFGIPEPPGTTLLRRGIPLWTYGTLIGAFLIALGFYLRKRSQG